MAALALRKLTASPAQERRIARLRLAPPRLRNPSERSPRAWEDAGETGEDEGDGEGVGNLMLRNASSKDDVELDLVEHVGEENAIGLKESNFRAPSCGAGRRDSGAARLNQASTRTSRAEGRSTRFRARSISRRAGMDKERFTASPPKWIGPPVCWGPSLKGILAQSRQCSKTPQLKTSQRSSYICAARTSGATKPSEPHRVRMVLRPGTNRVAKPKSMSRSELSAKGAPRWERRKLSSFRSRCATARLWR
mmetsp:Transcript_3071/g.8782  ORF Transcript_3071/g.8782 Transcript_3071/m.8782 type:complete len:251 (-) Transcript_3071:552-1304(-)